jgi:PAS domain-containing protein
MFNASPHGLAITTLDEGCYPQREAPATFESWKELIHPDDRPAAVGSLNRVLAGCTALFREEYRMRCGDGTGRWILDIGRVFEREAEGRPARAIGIHIDIHNLKTAEEELSRSNQELETRVAARTAALEELNESLRREIDARGRVEAELRSRTPPSSSSTRSPCLEAASGSAAPFSGGSTPPRKR